MTVEFQLTYEEYREASIEYARAAARMRTPRRRLVFFGGWVGAWIILSLIAELFGAGESAGREGLGGSLDLFMPIVIMSVVFVPIMAMAQGALRSGRQWGRVLIPLLCVAPLVAMLMTLKQWAPSPTPGAVSDIDWVNVFYPHISWILLTIVFAIYTGRLQRNRLLKAWQKQENLHRPQSFEITVDGVIVTSAVARHEYKWDAFPAFTDSGRLLLLNVSGVSYHIIPKRAFKNKEELEACVNMFKKLVGPKVAGFPVVTENLK